MAATMASTLALSRPSEKFGTHSTSVDIREKNSWRALTEARRTGVIALSYGVQFPHSFWLSTATKIRIAEFGGHFVHGRTDQDAPCGRCGGCPYRHRDGCRFPLQLLTMNAIQGRSARIAALRAAGPTLCAAAGRRTRTAASS